MIRAVDGIPFANPDPIHVVDVPNTYIYQSHSHVH